MRFITTPDNRDEYASDHYYKASSETRSELAVPLVDAEAGTIGVLNLESQALGAFGKEELNIFRAIAAVITHAINHTRRLREFTALHRISIAVSRGKALEDILRNTADEVRDLFQAGVVAVFLADREGQQLALAHHNKYPRAVEKRVQTIKIRESIAGKVLASGKSIVVWDMRNDSRADGTVRRRDGLRSLVDVPIKTDRGVIGVLAVLTKTIRPFSQHDVSLLESIGSTIGVAIGRAQAEAQFKQLYQAAHVPILTMRFDGQIVDINEAASKITGYERNELLRMNILDIVPGADDVQIARERLGKIALGELLPPKEFKIRHKQGRPVVIEVYLTPNKDSTGHVTAVQSMWIDITGPKRDEAVRQHLLKFSRASLRTFDSDELMAHVANIAMELLDSDACEIHLINGNSDVLESSVFTFAEGRQPDQYRSMKLDDGIIGRAASGGRVGIYNACMEPSLSLGDGPQHALVMPIQSVDRILGVLSLVRRGDGSRQLFTDEDSQSLESLTNMLTLQLEYRYLTELQHRQHTAEQVLAQVGLVGAMFRHKLRGFLGAISLTTRELRHRIQTSDPSTGALLNNLIEGSRTAARLKEQLSSMQKPLNQGTTIVELAPLVRAACAQVKRSANQVIEIDSSLDFPAVEGNEPLLIEVFEGLIRNAMDAMRVST